MASFKGLLKFLGKDDPAITIAVICIVNAIAKPIITMSNKKESAERKKFAALTESTTELTALGLCIPSTLIFKKLFDTKIIKPSLLPEKRKTLVQFASLVGLITANLLIAPVATQVVKLFIAKNKALDKPKTLDITSESVNAPLKSVPNKLLISNSEIYKKFMSSSAGSLKV